MEIYESFPKCYLSLSPLRLNMRNEILIALRLTKRESGVNPEQYPLL
jgi:hypothetical protein